MESIPLPYSFKSAVIARLDLILAYQQQILNNQQQEKKTMSAIDDALAAITADMTAQTTVVASLKPFIQGLFDQIKNMVPNLTPSQSAALDAIKISVEKNNTDIATAMVANTPSPTP